MLVIQSYRLDMPHTQNPLSGEWRKTLSIITPPSHHHLYNIHLPKGLHCFYRIIMSLNSPSTNFAFIRELPLPNSHLCEIHISTCINGNGDLSLHSWLKIANQNVQWHGRKVLLHFWFVYMRMRIAITCIVPGLRGPPYRRSLFLGVVLSGEVGKGRVKWPFVPRTPYWASEGKRSQ